MSIDATKVLRAARDMRWQEPERAIETLNGFLAANPRSKSAMLLLASIYADDYGKGVAGAERLLREVLAENTDSVSALCGLALLHGRTGTTVTKSESVRLLQRAAELSNDPAILLNLANKLWDVGLSDEALTEFERLESLALERGLPHFCSAATDAVREIRAGKPPTSLQYSWPEVD